MRRRRRHAAGSAIDGAAQVFDQVKACGCFRLAIRGAGAAGMQVGQKLQHGGAEVPLESAGITAQAIQPARQGVGAVVSGIEAVRGGVAQNLKRQPRLGLAIVQPARGRTGRIQARRQDAGVERGGGRRHAGCQE